MRGKAIEMCQGPKLLKSDPNVCDAKGRHAKK